MAEMNTGTKSPIKVTLKKKMWKKNVRVLLSKSTLCKMYR